MLSFYDNLELLQGLVNLHAAHCLMLGKQKICARFKNGEAHILQPVSSVIPDMADYVDVLAGIFFVLK